MAGWNAMSRPRNFAQPYRAALIHPTRSRWLTSSTVPTYVPYEKIRAMRAHKITKTRQGTKLTHFADSTETRPSFGPSFSKITECGHLWRTHMNSWSIQQGYGGIEIKVERHNVHSLPGVNQPWVVYCAPAEIFYFGHIRCLLVELAHGL